MMTLQGPWPTSVKVIQVRSPEFGDTIIDNGADYMIKQDMRGGFHTFLRDENTSLAMSFKSLDYKEGRLLEEFLLDLTGQIVMITAHDGQRWLGSFVTDPITLTQATGETYSLDVEFVGRKYVA